MPSSIKGHFYSIIAAVFSGLCIGVGKIILLDCSTTLLVAGLFISAVPINYAWWRLNRNEFRDIPFNPGKLYLITIQAGLSVTAIFTLWYGISMLDPTVGAFLTRFEVLVVIVLGIAIFKDRFKALEAIGAAVLLSGLLLIRYKADIDISRGMFIILGSATVFGISEIIAKRVVKYFEPDLFALIRNSHILIFILTVSIINGNLSSLDFGRYYYLIPLAGLLGPGMGRPMYLHALKHLEVSKVSTLNQLQPLAAAAVAYFSLGLIPEVKEWIGGFLIIGGCIIMIRGRQKRTAG